LYGEAGLKNLLTDAGTYAKGTAENIFLALVAFKLINEVLCNRLLLSFENWCLNNNKDLNSNVAAMLRSLRKMDCDSYPQSKIQIQRKSFVPSAKRISR
jgi:hypothetical protein